MLMHRKSQWLQSFRTWIPPKRLCGYLSSRLRSIPLCGTSSLVMVRSRSLESHSKLKYITLEYRNKTITRMFGGNTRYGCYFLAFMIFSFGMLRDSLWVCGCFFSYPKYLTSICQVSSCTCRPTQNSHPLWAIRNMGPHSPFRHWPNLRSHLYLGSWHYGNFPRRLLWYFDGPPCRRISLQCTPWSNVCRKYNVFRWYISMVRIYSWSSSNRSWLSPIL